MPFYFIGVVFGSGLHDYSDIAFFSSIFAFAFFLIFIGLIIWDKLNSKRQNQIGVSD